MLRRKLYGYESSSMSSEWHPPLMVLSCYTVIILEPLLKPRSRDPINAPNIFCTVITLSERSWIEVMSTFRRSMEGRIRPTHLLKLSESRSLMTTNRSENTILYRLALVQVGVLENVSQSQSLDDYAHLVNCI